MASTAPARAGYRSALRHRDLRRLLTAQLVSSSGSWAYNVALMVYLYDRTHSASWVAAGAVGRFVPTLLCSGYAGVIAERFERVRLMVRLNLLALLIQLGLAVTMWRHASPALAVALAALTSVTLSPYNPSVAALIPQVVAEEQLAAANALNATIDNLVTVAGPAIGALLLLVGGPALAVAANAASFGIAAIVLPFLKVRSRPSDVTDGGRAGPARQVLDGFRALGASAAVATFVAFSVLASFVYGTDTVLFIPISRVQLHTGSTGYGYLLAGLGVGGVAGAALVNRLAARTRLAPAILGGMAVFCLPTALLTVVHQPAVGFALEVVRGAGTLVVDTLAITALQRSAPKQMVARVFGAFFALVLAAISLGALLTPILLREGLHLTMLVYGLGVPALCLLALPRLVRADRVAAVRAAAIAPRVAILERLDLFSAASRSSLESLAEAAQEITVGAGTVIVREGDQSDAFYVVTDGSVSVSATGESGAAPVQLRTLGPDSYFGEIGLLGQVPRTATVTATSACTLLRIEGNDFLDALTMLSASPSLLRSAQARLAVTHPSSPALQPLLDPEQGDESAPVRSTSPS
ncbi:MAG TPA: MFS transporter [Streptosporangiaceae bacterium]|nr:MFS transporter [Streptosporangiaceae bacterium]